MSPCIALVQPVVTLCQFNPRAVLPTALPPFLNHTECAVTFLAYALCVLRALNETACNSQAMRPNVTATTAIQGTACSVDSKLVPLINRAIAVVQSRNTTVPYTRKVNGLPCTSTPAAVFSACQGLNVNVAVNSSGLFCPSLACAVAYTSYAACFLASSPCTAPTVSVKYPACPDASHQVQTFLSVCSAAVASGSFPGYLRAPSPPPTGCTTTSAALFQQYVQPTLVMPARRSALRLQARQLHAESSTVFLLDCIRAAQLSAATSETAISDLLLIPMSVGPAVAVNTVLGFAWTMSRVMALSFNGTLTEVLSSFSQVWQLSSSAGSSSSVFALVDDHQLAIRAGDEWWRTSLPSSQRFIQLQSFSSMNGSGVLAISDDGQLHCVLLTPRLRRTSQWPSQQIELGKVAARRMYVSAGAEGSAPVWLLTDTHIVPLRHEGQCEWAAERGILPLSKLVMLNESVCSQSIYKDAPPNMVDISLHTDADMNGTLPTFVVDLSDRNSIGTLRDTPRGYLQVAFSYFSLHLDDPTELSQSQAEALLDQLDSQYENFTFLLQYSQCCTVGWYPGLTAGGDDPAERLLAVFLHQRERHQRRAGPTGRSHSTVA